MVGTAGYMPMRMMKRKEIDLDKVNDDFHDFSLSSPARKIRRLNVQLPPIMEEEREQENFHVSPSPIVEDGVFDMPFEGAVAEADPVNEERAIVLYKPPLLQSSPSVSVSLDSLDLVSGFKNQLLRASQSGQMKMVEDEKSLSNKDNAITDKCLAVIPWVPSQFQLSSNPGTEALQTEAPESMEADDAEQVAMEIEDNNSSSIGQVPGYEFGGMREGEGLPQWQQQHCLIPQLPQSNPTPVTWFQ